MWVGACHGKHRRGVELQANFLRAAVLWDCSSGTSWHVKNFEDADVCVVSKPWYWEIACVLLHIVEIPTISKRDRQLDDDQVADNIP